MEKKLAFVSLATAFAMRVFPVPGVPWRRTPLGGSIPSLVKTSGCFMGSSIISLIRWTSFRRPPTSS